MSWAAIISAIVSGLFGAIFIALRTRRQDSERDRALTGKAVDDAALETMEAIHETAIEREGVPDSPADRGALVDELRRDAGTGPGGDPAARQRRPF